MMTKSCSKFFFAISFFFIVMLAAFSNGWKKNGTRLELKLVREETLFTLDEILGMDRLRVESLQAGNTNINYYNNNNNYTKNEKVQVQIPAKSVGSRGYVVTISLGTPSHDVTLLMDTGSDVTWTQCRPCRIGDCFSQEEPLFNPSKSSTYSRIPCQSPYCTDLGYRRKGVCTRSNPDCQYMVEYGDDSSTSGFFVKDRIILSLFDVFLNFRFGCSNHHTGSFKNFTGVFGLGRGPASFVSQRKYRYQRVFSYCLPDKNSRGFLSFGPREEFENDEGMVFTPFVPGTFGSLYYVAITAISVGRTQLPIPLSVLTPAEGVAIDSGAVFTYLPPVAYQALAKEYKRQMGPQRSAPAYSREINTCFHVKENVDRIPTMSFTFKGDATLSIQPSGILHFVKPGLGCLAFFANQNPGDILLLGCMMQTKTEVMFDGQREKIGFRSNPSCS